MPSMTEFRAIRILPALLFLILSPGTGKSAPQIVFDSESQNWGTVFQGSEVSRTFIFWNRGDESLEIERVRTSCGCTVAKDWPRKVAPGEEGIITATLDTGRRQGFSQINVTVTSNDPRRPGVTLKMAGVVDRAVEFRPGQDVVFRGIAMGVEAERTMEIFPMGDHEFEIEDIENKLNFLAIRREETKNERGAKGYRLIVKLRGDAPPGTIGGYYTIKALLDGEHPLEIRAGVRATVLGEIEVSPMRGFFGSTPGGESHVFTLKRRDGEALRIRKIRPDRKEIMGEVLGEEKGKEVKVKINAKFPPTSESGPVLVGAIKILTDVRKQPEMEIPYTVRLRPPAKRLQSPKE
jgi:hypothetical protein